MKCKTCKGRGSVEREQKDGSGKRAVKVKEICEVCDGSGRIHNRKRGGRDKGFDWSIKD